MTTNTITTRSYRLSLETQERIKKLSKILNSKQSKILEDAIALYADLKKEEVINNISKI